MHAAQDVLDFWFVEHGEKDWFGGKPEFDAALAARFLHTHQSVAGGEAAFWRASPSGRLAEIIVLDQFSRQLFRGRAEAFASDAMALELARAAIAAGDDLRLEPRRRQFVYMPFMHAESLAVHEAESIPIFERHGDEGLLAYEMAHVEVLRRFGRYPRRNAALGRASTPAERDYIESGTGMF